MTTAGSFRSRPAPPACANCAPPAPSRSTLDAWSGSGGDLVAPAEKLSGRGSKTRFARAFLVAWWGSARDAMGRARTKQQRKPVRRRVGRRNRTVKRVPRSAAGVLPAFAHDVRTALTGVLALGELLADAKLGEREHRWASDIKTSAEYLAAL